VLESFVAAVHGIVVGAVPVVAVDVDVAAAVALQQNL